MMEIRKSTAENFQCDYCKGWFDATEEPCFVLLNTGLCYECMVDLIDSLDRMRTIVIKSKLSSSD